MTTTPAGLRVVERGDPKRDAALLLHGFTGSIEAWGDEILSGLEAEVRVLAVDLPGHGGSPAPPDPGAFGLPAVVPALLDVLDRAGVERADWIGYSMGGRIALAAAVQRPDRIGSLVVESSGPGLQSPSARARRRRDDEALARRLELHGIEDFVDFWLGRPLFATQRGLPDRIREESRARRLEQSPEALAACLRGLGTGSQPSFWEDLPAVHAPTLLVTGSEDGKYERIAAEMAALLPRAIHRSVPGVGHAVHLEAPGSWLEAVIPFLRSRPSPSGPGPG